MKTSAFYAVIGLGVLLAAVVVWFGLYAHHATAPVNGPNQTVGTGTSTPSQPSLQGFSIYTNGDYGFSIFYPATTTVSTTFDSAYILPTTWRVNALQNATGTPVIEVVGYQTKSTTHFPRYFKTEVRIGVSKDPQEIAACTKVGNGERAMPSAAFGGATWSVFAMSDAAMMQYNQGTSYRTMHDGMCYALEQIEVGSSYRDVPSPSDIPESVLQAHFNELDSVVRSFSFARP